MPNWNLSFRGGGWGMRQKRKVCFWRSAKHRTKKNWSDFCLKMAGERSQSASQIRTGGGGEIRTHESPKATTAFRERPDQPLQHPTIVNLENF